METQTEWLVRLPMTKPLTLNERQSYFAKAAAVKELRRSVCLLARLHHIPACRKIEVTVSYTPRDVRRRDRINLIPTLKACEDGLVDAHVVPDDTPEYVESLMPRINPVKRGLHGEVWLHVRQLR